METTMQTEMQPIQIGYHTSSLTDHKQRIEGARPHVRRLAEALHAVGLKAEDVDLVSLLTHPHKTLLPFQPESFQAIAANLKSLELMDWSKYKSLIARQLNLSASRLKMILLMY